MAADVLTSDFMNHVLRAKLGENLFTSATYGVHLFVNDVTPDCFISLGGLTECSLAGYSTIFLSSGTWLVAPYPTVADCGWQAAYPPITFTFTASGQTIYGLYVYEHFRGFLSWTKRFDVAYVVPDGGGSLQVQLNLRELQCS